MCVSPLFLSAQKGPMVPRPQLEAPGCTPHQGAPLSAGSRLMEEGLAPSVASVADVLGPLCRREQSLRI